MTEIRIPYQPNKLLYILSGILFASCAGVLGTLAVTNEQGILLARFFEFSTQGATILYWALTAAAVVFVVLVALLLVKSIKSNREIVLNNISITSPKSGLSKVNVTVEYSDISHIAIQQVQHVKILNIVHSNGKLSIASSMLPSKQVFEELVLQLNNKLANLEHI